MVLMAVSVLAASDDLSPLDTTMAETDTQTAEYCVDGYTPEDSTIDITVTNVCKDLNSITGCQAADDATQTEFTATPASSTLTLTGGAGCVDIDLQTTSASGIFYYTVNGEITGEVITSETGSVLVPEFTTIGAALALAGAGLFIYKKKRQ
jgi:LPXTG-motif cell wall-anchored protein